MGEVVEFRSNLFDDLQDKHLFDDVTDPCVISQLRERGRFTPDFKELRMYENIPVFVYNYMQGDNSANKFFDQDGAHYLGEGQTCGPIFVMKGLYFPVVFEDTFKSSPSRATVQGEIYTVTPKQLLALDRIMDNNVAFKRQLKNCFLKDQRSKFANKTVIPSIPCWIYIGIHDYWKNFEMSMIQRFYPSGPKDRDKSFYRVFRHPSRSM